MNRRTFLARVSSALAVSNTAKVNTGPLHPDHPKPVVVHLRASQPGVTIPYVDGVHGGFGRVDVTVEPGETQTHVINDRTFIIHRADS